nr:hypothetical protein [Vibrio splendidus]
MAWLYIACLSKKLGKIILELSAEFFCLIAVICTGSFNEGFSQRDFSLSCCDLGSSANFSQFFDYLSTIDLVDYIAYSGVLLVVLAGITFDGNNLANQDFLSLMIHRELVSRTNDFQDETNKVSFAVNVGLIGIFLLIASGVMAWHISK